MSEPTKKHIVLVGCGNVGGFAGDHIMRLENVGQLSICDVDVYEEKNLRSQNIVPADVGRPKAVVQADRLHRINPYVGITAYADAIENVPLGCLEDADVILAAVDSKRARQVINQIAKRLNVPWIDSGVEADRLLARVTVYYPGEEDPCIECNWTSAQYEDLDTTYPCNPDAGMPAATNAPSSLGALCGSLLALEASKVISGDTRHDGKGYEIFLEADYYNLYPATLRFNPECRVPEHRLGAIKPPGGFETRSIDTTLGELLRSVDAGAESDAPNPNVTDSETPPVRGASNSQGAPGSPEAMNGPETTGSAANAPSRLHVVGQRFVTHLTCNDCGHRRGYVKLRVSLKDDGSYKCDRCGGEMTAAGFDTLEELDAANLSAPTASRTLRSVGIRDGDVLCLSRAQEEPRYVVTLNGTHGARTKKTG